MLSLAILLQGDIGCAGTIDAQAVVDEHEETPLRIWFKQPAAEWNEGLPIGNGRLGGMIYGTPALERIGLNEDTIWSGEKRYDRDRKGGHTHLESARQLIRGGKHVAAEKLVEEKVLAERFPSGSHAYQILANLWIESPQFKQVDNYRRELDLNNALATIKFDNDGVQYSREYFSSFPDQVMIVKYSADKAKKVSLSVRIERTEDTLIELSENRIDFSEHVGDGVGVKIHGIVDFAVEGGASQIVDGKIVISNADEVVMRIVAASDYRGLNPLGEASSDLTNVYQYSYNELVQRHVADYQSLFKRLRFTLSDGDGEDLPTDVRLNQIIAGGQDNYLSQLQYQFGRYLLISSSRPGTMPANLQGIWVDGLKPAWNSDYHININIQMNYWMAEMTNLSELHKPFLEFIGDLRELGRITARETYNSDGFVAHHTSDAWHVTSAFGKSRYGMWPLGAAWASQHLYTHYEYTEDRQYLREQAYPIMKEAAEFFVDYMFVDPDTGWLSTGPSISPENKFLVSGEEMATLSMSPTMDRQIIFELFRNCIAAANILGIDEDFRTVLANKSEQIQPTQIGSDGRLMEWSEKLEEYDPGHRHISHLYALHPSNQISQTKTPELFEAARKTIDFRLANGGGHTGWSRAWIINFFARLLEGRKAYENIVELQRKSTLPNLLVHPPFQIDGNFGLVSGITEMLMQSHNGEIHLLPAIPAEWPSGSIHGVVARGGFELDIDWKDGLLESLVVRTKLGNTLNLRYGSEVLQIGTRKGDRLRFNGQMELRSHLDSRNSPCCWPRS